MTSIEDLRGLAKLNLCEECYKKYTAIIEPNIRPWMSLEPSIYCRNVDFFITLMVMKLEGVFSGYTFLTIDEDMDEKNAQGVNIKAFRNIKRNWSLSRKIDYLKEHGILKASSHKLLHKARKIRNIFSHDPFINIPEKDLELLECASTLTDRLWSATEFSEKNSVYMLSNAEKYAELLLSTYNMRP